MYAVPAIVNRCGVIAGPWQMGKVDQGFVSLWAARHLWGVALSYIGFGGRGLQVRDVLHVQDLCELVERQIDNLPRWSGAVLNVGGGASVRFEFATRDGAPLRVLLHESSLPHLAEWETAAARVA